MVQRHTQKAKIPKATSKEICVLFKRRGLIGVRKKENYLKGEGL